MLTDKEKKTGIIMLVIGGVVVIALIISRIYTDRSNQGIRGSGVSNGESTSVTASVGVMTPIFYDTALGEDRGESSLGQAAALKVVEDIIRETETAIVAGEEIEKEESFESVQESSTAAVDYASLGGYMKSLVNAGRYKTLSGTGLETDDKSLTGGFVPLTDIARDGDLVMCSILYDQSNLTKVRVLTAGARAEGNDLTTLYNEVIAKNYKEGTYCAYLIDKDSMTCLGGDELLCLLLADSTTEDVAQYRADGETLDSLVTGGKVSLAYGGSDGDSSQYSSVYEMCGLGFVPYFVETMGGTQQLSVLHLINDKIYVENYGVGNLRYVSTGERVGGVSDEDSGAVTPEVSDEEVTGVGDEVAEDSELVAVFTGYYCW